MLAGWRRRAARLEPLLLSQRELVLEDQAEPLGVVEGARLGVALKVLEALGHAVQAKRVQLLEGRVGQHDHLRQWK